MTENELVELALRALPERLQKLAGTVVRRAAADEGPGLESAGGDKLLGELERLLGTKLPDEPIRDADSADVAFHEDTPVGRRTTIVQIRQGKLSRMIGQA